MSALLISESLRKGPFPGYDGGWYITGKLCEKMCQNAEGTRYDELE